MGTKTDYEVFEVFVQRTHADHHVHVGSLVAPSPDMALQTARENFLRREKAINVWVVPRSQVTESAEQGTEFLSRELDRKYREVSGYIENGRLWRLFKEKAMTIEEIVEYVKVQRQKPSGKKAEKGGRGA